MCEEQHVERIRRSGAPVQHVVCVDGAPEGTISLGELAGGGPAGFDFEAAWQAVRPDDVLNLIGFGDRSRVDAVVPLAVEGLPGNGAAFSWSLLTFSPVE